MIPLPALSLYVHQAMRTALSQGFVPILINRKHVVGRVWLPLPLNRFVESPSPLQAQLAIILPPVTDTDLFTDNPLRKFSCPTAAVVLEQRGVQDVDDADDEGGQIGYADDGPQEQLFGKLTGTNDRKSLSALGEAGSNRGRAQHARQQHTNPAGRGNNSIPAHFAEQGVSQSPSRAVQHGFHDLLDELLTQAYPADPQRAMAQHVSQDDEQGAGHQHTSSQHGTPAEVPTHGHKLQQQATHQQAPRIAAAGTKSNRQLMTELLQPNTQQQQAQLPAAPQEQPPPAHSHVAANTQQKGPKQLLKSVLYSAPTARTQTPLGRISSTPQRAAPKKKPRFSIKDTPSQATPTAFVTPQAKRQKTAAGTAGGCGAGAGSGAKSMASLLGGGVGGMMTPSRPAAVAADASKTPVQPGSVAGMAALFATPKHSSSQPPGLAGGQHTPQAATAAAPAATAAAPDASKVTPAALFSNEGSAQRPAAAGASATRHVPQSSSKKRRGADIDPLEVMSASRERQRAFLQSLPAAAAAGPQLASLQLQGACVPLGTNLTKVWQQLQDARKKQQDRLEEQPDAATGALELQVINKSWEAHLVKCCCTITKCPPPPPTPAQQQQGKAAGTQRAAQQPEPPQLQVGTKVFVFVNSKSSHTVELQAGSRVKLHPPWHFLQQPGALPVLLGHFLS